jgi:membrane associated rhomboid family serine protease
MNNLINKSKQFWAQNTSAFMRLLVVNVAFTISVWLVGWLVKDKEGIFVQVPDSFSELLIKPYVIITYMFAHASFWHLIGNMFILYFIGIVFEDLLGTRKTYITYFASGIMGALLYVVLVNINSVLIGASGAIMGILYGLTMLRPNYEFYLYCFLKLRLWWITVAYAAFDLINILAFGAKAGGQICHIGGGITGGLLVLFWMGKLNFYIVEPKVKKTPFQTITINKEPKRAAVKPYKKGAPSGIPSQEEIDEILDKINLGGYSSLTKNEKDTLFRAKDIEV